MHKFVEGRTTVRRSVPGPRAPESRPAGAGLTARSRTVPPVRRAGCAGRPWDRRAADPDRAGERAMRAVENTVAAGRPDVEE